tara:strand:+ start:244 stop:798 length:555 start_codon:yes stop_codon:yes gene_type:complete
MALSSKQQQIWNTFSAGFKKACLTTLANRVYDRAQELVPEGESGNLKKSGSLSISDTGFNINYSAPYAMLVHDGESEDSGDYIQFPKDHTRRYKDDIKRGPYKGSRSRPVSYPNGRNFKEKRVRKWSGSERGWYTTDKLREGNPWITQAYKEVFTSLTTRERKYLLGFGFDLDAEITKDKQGGT